MLLVFIVIDVVDVFFVICVGVVVDGGYFDWSEFFECSVICGEGLKIWKWLCNNLEFKNGGKNCNDLGVDMDIKFCNLFFCCECVYFW